MSGRAKKPPTQEPPTREPPSQPSLDNAPTTIFDTDDYPGRRSPQPPGDTIVDRPRPPAVQAISMKDPQPIQAISMKTPVAEPRHAEANPPTPILQRPKLRADSEITPAKPQNLGHVAPPYDPVAARKRRAREYVMWGCLAVILASGIALVVWFAAR